MSPGPGPKITRATHLGDTREGPICRQGPVEAELLPVASRAMSSTMETSEDIALERGVTSDSPHRSWWVRAAVALLAVAFMTGAFGYLLGTRGAATPSNAVDVGFLQDMSDHHDQAVTMALSTYHRTNDPVVRGFAQDVLLFQRYELGLMSAYLEDHNAILPEYDEDRLTMAWMGMSLPLRDMTGMASVEDLDALGQATGADLDRMFLELMSAHHVGGAHMSSYAAERAADHKVRALAERMAKYQAIEVAEYRRYLERLDAAGL